MPVHEIDDDDASSRKDRRARGEFQHDEAGNVTSARIPMMLRDSVAMRDANRRAVQAAIKAERQRGVVDGSGSTAGLHRPGSRVAADRGAYDAVAEAYAQMIADKSEAWRAGPGGNQQDASAWGTEYAGAREGDACTVRAGAAEGYLEGGPGHIARVDGKLLCLPDQRAQRRPDSMSAADAEAIKQMAYDERVRAGEQAWKNLGRS